MSNSLKKLNRGTRNFFKKIDRGADNFFKKTIPNAAKKVGGQLDQAGDWVVDTSRKVGNTLEKFSDDIAMGAGLAGSGLLYATGYGAPAAAALMSASLAAGNTAKQLGSKVKQGSNALQSIQDKTTGFANKTANTIRDKGLDLQNHAKSEYNKNLQALNSNIGMAKQQANADINNFVKRSKARANMAITSGSNALSNAINNAPNFV